jgi:predicted permease
MSPPLFDAVRCDSRYALRMLRRSPGFTATAVVTLALVIGANTAVFTLADAILVKPLPYPEPEHLAYVAVAGRTIEGEEVLDRHDGATWEQLRDGLRGGAAIDVAVMAGTTGQHVNLAAGNTARSVGQARVGAGYFRALGVQPFVGRAFTPGEDRPGGPAVAVLSYELWQRLFDGDASAVGNRLLLRGEPYAIVGVMPRGFRDLNHDVDVWTPVRASPSGEGAGINYKIIARVKPGRSWAEALAAMPPLDADYFRRRMGPSWADARPTGRFTLLPMQQVLAAECETPLATLGAAVGAVLLIACVNLAALLLSRGVSRTKEIATRIALGSRPGAIARQLLVESLLLGAFGGALGLLVGYLALGALEALGAATFRAWDGVTLDGRALAVTAGLALATSLLFGVFPALQAARLDVNTAFAEGGARSIAGGSRHSTRRGLVAAQVALGVVLLVVAGLLMRTFFNLRSLDPGLDPSHVLTASVSLQDARYTTAAQMNRLFDESLRRIESTPGVESAAVSLSLPYRQLLNDNFAFTDEAAPSGPRITNVMYATPGFFATLRIPLRAGRTLEESDTAASPRVVVMSEDFVRLSAKGENPIGRRIRIAGAEREIVGVVGNVKITSAGFMIEGMLRGPLTSGPLVYLPATQTPDGYLGVHRWYSPTWTVRAHDMRTAEAAVRQAIAGVDPLLPIGAVRPMAAVLADATAEKRLLMVLVGVLASAALLLSAVGIHGLIAHFIAERRRELGVRMALGATAAQTVRSVALSGMALAAAGAAAGLGLAWMAVRVLDSRSMLWGVESRDPATFAGTAVFVLAVACVASVLPSLKILRLDPATTLRE